jgi:general secretion pathway protein G
MPLGIAATRRRRRAFTLVELLCVIGTVTLLLGMLMPALSRVRRAAHAAACMSNLRQWGLATQLYANANHGYLPRRGQGVQPTLQIDRLQDWFNALPPMLHMPAYTELAAAGQLFRPDGTRSIWLCPEAADMGSTNYWSYGMNMGLSVEQAGQNNGMPDKISGIGNTAVMVFMADAPGNYCSVFPSKFPGGYNPVPRHNKYVNICFLDGHVASIAACDIGIGTGLIETADVKWHPPNSTWNSAQ